LTELFKKIKVAPFFDPPRAHLDYGNVILVGLPPSIFRRLQSIMNALYLQRAFVGSHHMTLYEAWTGFVCWSDYSSRCPCWCTKRYTDLIRVNYSSCRRSIPGRRSLRYQSTNGPVCQALYSA